MNKANLKSYAPKARLDFIKAVTERANVLGISASGAMPAEVRGDVAIIDGREWPAKVAGQREELLSRIKRHGFEQTMDEVAYTWFNRFAALRYMEIHDYLDHGWRVLSSRDGGLPEILRHASEVSLPGLNADRAREMHLAGNQDNELYKLLLVAQCNELSRVMPFLFERIDDDTELLLPENLLRTDSIVAKLVESVPEEDWQEIEVIGWLYQFYISEKKDQVIGKVVKSEDIPAATQLFTPNWIVQYLVQNSVGRLWLMANPTSTLASQWPYYIQPAEQTPKVQAQLDALIQTRVREDGETLNPETITVLDPACGSGHILVVAYDVLKAIYLERGYQPRTIPRLILEKNLYGLDIDDRAAQLAAFALLMKARADDRRLFADPPKLNVLSLQSSAGLNYEELCTHLAPFNVQRHNIWGLIEAFEHAKTFGSLIQIPYALKTHLAVLLEVLTLVKQCGDMYAVAAATDLVALVLQAQMLSRRFDAVVANPPYMSGKGMAIDFREFAQQSFPASKSDLFAMFVERCKDFGYASSSLSFVTPYVWMFISSYEQLREKILSGSTLASLVQLEYNAFEPACIPVCIFELRNSHIEDFVGGFVRLSDFKGHQNQSPRTLEAIRNPDCGWFFKAKPDDFKKISGSPISYWVSRRTYEIFSTQQSVGSVSSIRAGMATGDNNRHVRIWHEIQYSKFMPNADSVTTLWSFPEKKWVPFNKGGEFRKWYGNFVYVINYDQKSYQVLKKSGNKCPSESFYFRECLTWSDVTSGSFSLRYFPAGSVFSTVGNSIFEDGVPLYELGCNLISSPVTTWLKLINPTLHANPGDVSKVPLANREMLESNSKVLWNSGIDIARRNWDAYEASWDFQADKIVESDEITLNSSFQSWKIRNGESVAQLLNIEVENNRNFINAYGLQEELSPEVPESEITLVRADREKDCQRLISYAIGCVMGRYSLDEPGLVYAHAGNVGFDPSRYEKKFPADADGIVPLTDEPWFTDDAANRVREFLHAVWGPDTLQENMAWLAESLGTKGSETPDETVRRYLADKFFKDHLQTYKKRPIYWLFSSGKQGTFQALVYLHRYNEGTLARMRAEYVVPLISKMVSRLEMLNQDVAAASSAAARTKLQKQIEALRKKQLELLSYDEKLRHYADMRITLDLDDGVKVNYAKFGDLVAESKVITGGSDE